ncbi:PepSY-like domain-containing protein [Campylobacter felis]|uniref:PepSY-like domain-containing protein n=1 Tax=Campylobacter felis TaxID=2974565 RepID=UPI00255F8699|nr:PepSY-like domain-containing protein [Campylobacter felis]
MKIIILILTLFLNLKADIILSPQNLPNAIKEFLQKNFKAQVSLAQRDDNAYEIALNDGTELEFDISGEWKEIEARGTAISYEVLPPHIASILKNEFKENAIKEIERKINYYKIKFYNNFEIIIDFNGTILRREYDD